MNKISQWTDIGHGSPKDKIWIIMDEDIQVVSAGNGRSHTSVWGAETNIEGHWRGRYEVSTGFCSIAPSDFQLHLRRPPQWLLVLLCAQFGVVRFYYFADGIDSFSPNPDRGSEKMKILKYGVPESDIKQACEEKQTIFLAGPTVRGHQPHLLPSWRRAAEEEFRKEGFDGNLIVPEFEDPSESDKGRYDIPDWECTGLSHADAIMFWVPRTRELIGLTTNYEFGYCLAMHSAKMIYGRPNDAYRIDYLDIAWRRHRRRSLLILSNLTETVRAAIRCAVES